LNFANPTMRHHVFQARRIFVFLAIASLLQRKCRGQTSADCPETYGSFNACVGYSGDGASDCESCTIQYLLDYNNIDQSNNETLTSCTQVDDETCAALDYCSAYCAGCYQELITYAECEWDCTIDQSCVSGTDTNPSPTSSPTVLQCPQEHAAYTQCVQTSGSVADCNSCGAARAPDEVTTCAYSEQLTCTLIEDCPICGDCQEEYTTWINCLNEGDCLAFDCASPTLQPSAPPATSLPSTRAPTLALPSEPPSSGPGNVSDDDGAGASCQSLKDDLDGCMFDQLPTSQSASCKSCVEAKYDQLLEQSTSTKCSTIQSEMCDAVSATCDCGACASAYHALVQCRIDAGDSGCKVMCEGLDSHQTSGAGPLGVKPLLAISASLSLLLIGLM
jgi:hypothetical protein